jgi:2-isopropylmalate synthase
MTPTALPDLIHDWNANPDKDTSGSRRKIGLVDETLRDGLQGPSVIQPRVKEKLRLLHLMAELGIDDVNIGLPAAGERFRRESAILAREIVQLGLPLDCHCAARTMQVDLEPIVEISQRTGGPIGVGMFVGSSPIRHYTEGWELVDVLKRVRQAVSFAVENNLRVLFVTEDTTRTSPEVVRQLYCAAIEQGAQNVVLSDTTGSATPRGAERLVRFVREVVGPDILIDWHGHRDRGLATACAVAAVEAGADRVHATALGIGERSGNTPMEQVLVNLQLLGYIDRDLTSLPTYCRLTSEACGVPLSASQPVVGEDAFRTASGIHAAAVVKALDLGNQWLADRVYSGVPAALIGRSQKIEIGPMSGTSNVRYALEQLGVNPTDDLVRNILQVAKTSDRVMSEVELLRTVVGVLSTCITPAGRIPTE